MTEKMGIQVFERIFDFAQAKLVNVMNRFVKIKIDILL